MCYNRYPVLKTIMNPSLLRSHRSITDDPSLQLKKKNLESYSQGLTVFYPLKSFDLIVLNVIWKSEIEFDLSTDNMSQLT